MDAATATQPAEGTLGPFIRGFRGQERTAEGGLGRTYRLRMVYTARGTFQRGVGGPAYTVRKVYDQQ